MNAILIFIWVWLAMVATGFWEAYVEGRNAWDRKKLGWKLSFGFYSVTAYHFWLFWVMYPLLLTLPLVIYGWDIRLFGILLSAYMSGLVIEDLTWFLVNPVVKVREFSPSFAGYYPWLRIGRWKVPLLYLFGLFFSVLAWALFWS